MRLKRFALSRRLRLFAKQDLSAKKKGSSSEAALLPSYIDSGMKGIIVG